MRDGAVHQYCLFHRVTLPDCYPVQPRPGMATRRPLVVATRADGAELLCGCEHDGQHLWPDGDAVVGVEQTRNEPPQHTGAG